ncbi:flagellar basal body P-ring formation chaperone FlgA [Thiomicrorhabdus aquaedulcis]|uniref:flagellar basal body P-ring formation chaperone FlgA n=1 Tax=Thiomicrorhabdus aquaedulcis TaxID=2211106 RepID=UPI000FD7D89A|nr:flagellar basal body P-ring formation chaperone FlgA [Thiomicrorhabdus aquaedulcis]
MHITLTHFTTKALLWLILATFFGALFTPWRVFSAPIPTTVQSIESIHDQVLEYVKQKTDQHIYEAEITLKKLSPTLQLPLCTQPLELVDRNPSDYAGRMTIGVNCAQPMWKVFVPAVVDGKLPAIMTTQAIAKQAVIKPDDVEQVLTHYKNVQKGSLINLENAVGMRTKKAIGPRSVLNINDLQPPFWVFKNQQINIITYIGTIEVQTNGTALNDAVEQQPVEVKNGTSEIIIKGIVIAPNTVLIP